MKLNKAIEHLKDQCIFGLSRLFTENDIEAIDTVLEELNNRIPRKDVEEIYNTLQELLKNPLDSTILLMYVIQSLDKLINKE